MGPRLAPLVGSRLARLVGSRAARRLGIPRIGPRRMLTAGMVGVAAITALLVTVGPGTSLWWVRALMLLLGLSWAQALVPLQAAAFATITPEATGAASTLFNTGRQLGMAVGVAILTTVASAVGLTQNATGRAVTPHLAAYHAGLVTASVIALIAAGISQLVDDRAAAPTMRRPKPSHREAAAATHYPLPTTQAGYNDPAERVKRTGTRIISLRG